YFLRSAAGNDVMLWEVASNCKEFATAFSTRHVADAQSSSVQKRKSAAVLRFSVCDAKDSRGMQGMQYLSAVPYFRP
ncbi:MAG: hypothetical protein AB7O46_09845, partial [Xanthobacteraceae bacterium]